MKLFALCLILVSLSGCVTYTQHFKPGRGGTFCANLATCKQLP